MIWYPSKNTIGNRESKNVGKTQPEKIITKAVIPEADPALHKKREHIKQMIPTINIICSKKEKGMFISVRIVTASNTIE